MSRYDEAWEARVRKDPGLFERDVSEGGMSMGGGGKRAMGRNDSCPKSSREDGRHLVTVLSCIQSVEHFRCDYCGGEWYD